MKRLAFVMLGAVAFIALSAASALAQSNIPPGGDDVGGEVIVRGEVVTPPDGTAFTGGNITVWMVLVAGLLLVGLGLWFAGRRRGKVAAQ
jgi:LPXTG-motif cell wall-anchored protein